MPTPSSEAFPLYLASVPSLASEWLQWTNTQGYDFSTGEIFYNSKTATDLNFSHLHEKFSLAYYSNLWSHHYQLFISLPDKSSENIVCQSSAGPSMFKSHSWFSTNLWWMFETSLSEWSKRSKPTSLLTYPDLLFSSHTWPIQRPSNICVSHC